MQNLENPFAGQGPVLLDIGGDIGALVVAMPAESEGLEVEIRPAGTTAAPAAASPAAGHDHHDEHDHHDHHDHSHGHGHDHSHADAAHGHDHPHDHGTAHHPHVGVVARPGADGPAHSLVYPEVTEGSYELVPIPGDTVVMTADVTGGVVTYTSWPEGAPTA